MKGKNKLEKALEIYAQLINMAPVLSDERKQRLYKDYLHLLQNAAYCGNVEAQYNLAQESEDMNFFIRNPRYSPKRMFYWYSKAAQHNHPEALNRLATLYESGLGCTRNLKKAFKLYKLSAEAGSALGKKNYQIIKRQNPNVKFD